MKTVSELLTAAKTANGKRRQRILGQAEADEILSLVAQHQDNPEVHTIRVYSHDGFVANSYNYRAEIAYFEAIRNPDGEFVITAKNSDAHRSHGSAALTTINGRAA